MTVSILREGDTLIASIQSEMLDSELVNFQKELAELAYRPGIRAVIIDLSGLDTLDSFTSRVLQGGIDVIRLRGSEIVVVGMSPAVAITMVELGLTIQNVRTAVTLDDGFRLLREGRHRPAPPAGYPSGKTRTRLASGNNDRSLLDLPEKRAEKLIR